MKSFKQWNRHFGLSHRIVRKGKNLRRFIVVRVFSKDRLEHTNGFPKLPVLVEALGGLNCLTLIDGLARRGADENCSQAKKEHNHARSTPGPGTRGSANSAGADSI